MSASTLEPPRPVRGGTASESQQSVASTFAESEDLEGFDDDLAHTTATTDVDKPIVMDGVDIALEQEAQIAKIASLFDVSRYYASALLRTFQWREEHLVERFLEDAGAALAKAGLRSEVKRQRSSETTGASVPFFECGVCFTDAGPDEASSLSCGHRFCNDCWTGHLAAQIGDGNADKIRCMADKCQALVEPILAQALLSAPMYAKFARFANKQFVDDCPHLKWCPGAGCEKVLKVRDLGQCNECACDCGMTFCFRCSREIHFPLSCETLTCWEDKVRSDSATGQWIAANSKRCRKCNAHIEKNGGCNWIHCRCGHEFCFFCYSTERSHHGQPCNAPPSADMEGAQNDLAYFMHYFERYDGHRKSQELETALRATAETAIGRELDRAEAGQTAAELAYLSESVEVLIQCRRLLKNTYPFAFMMPRDTNAKLLFEALQAQLEASTEMLSQQLEAEGPPDKRHVLRRKDDANQRMRNMRQALEASPSDPRVWGREETKSS